MTSASNPSTARWMLLASRRYLSTMPSWPRNQSSESVDVHTGMCAPHVVNPLDYTRYMVGPSAPSALDNSPGDFPFLHARSTIWLVNADLVLVYNQTLGFVLLKILRLVKTMETRGYTCATWCEVIAKKLCRTLCALGDDAKMRIKLLRNPRGIGWLRFSRKSGMHITPLEGWQTWCNRGRIGTRIH